MKKKFIVVVIFAVFIALGTNIIYAAEEEAAMDKNAKNFYYGHRATTMRKIRNVALVSAGVTFCASRKIKARSVGHIQEYIGALQE